MKLVVAKRRRVVVPVLASLLCLMACKPAAPSLPAIEVEISHVVGTEPLVLSEGRYETAAGEEFGVTKLRYYLSNFRLRRADGSWYAPVPNADSPAGYFLIDEADASSKRFALLPAPAGEYQGIEFLVGIDAARNHAGAQTGTLDPARGMFWMWNTGYIFLKLEGRSEASREDGGRIEYHVGGDELARTVYLPLSPKPARLEAGIQPVIHLAVDVAAVFGGAQPLKIAETPSVMEAREAGPIADASATMFRVDHIHHEPVPAAR